MTKDLREKIEGLIAEYENKEEFYEIQSQFIIHPDHTQHYLCYEDLKEIKSKQKMVQGMLNNLRSLLEEEKDVP